MVLHSVPSRCKTIYPEPGQLRLPRPPGSAVVVVSAGARIFLKPILRLCPRVTSIWICAVERPLARSGAGWLVRSRARVTKNGQAGDAGASPAWPRTCADCRQISRLVRREFVGYLWKYPFTPVPTAGSLMARVSRSTSADAFFSSTSGVGAGGTSLAGAGA
jgi:hypothetical protein